MIFSRFENKTIILFLVFLLPSCSYFRKEANDPLLAKVYDQYLYTSEVQAVLPNNIEGRDSINFVNNYINAWIRQKLLVYEAKSNLTAGEADFTKQLDEYRNSLIIYAYETKLIRQRLDTVVTEQEIENYYNENKSRFELKGNIIKFNYVKLPLRSFRVRQFRALLQSQYPGDLNRLEELCIKYATDYWFRNDWILFDDVLSEIPLHPENQEAFLKMTSYSEISDSIYWHLFKINDFKTIDSIPPLTFERENIRNIILNGRKLKLIEDTRQTIMDAAMKNNRVDIFYKGSD